MSSAPDTAGSQAAGNPRAKPDQPGPATSRRVRTIGEAWRQLLAPRFVGGHAVRLLTGGDQLFPAMVEAIAAARSEIWLATYIYNDDGPAAGVIEALVAAQRRGVRVGIVVDGFGSKAAIPALERRLAGSGVQLAVFRPFGGLSAMFQPEILRRLHLKLCAVDGERAFAGGINLIDDRLDIRHGRSDAPRLDFAIELAGPLAAAVAQTVRAIHTRASLGRQWRERVGELILSDEPAMRLRALMRSLRVAPPAAAEGSEPVSAAFVVRDNVRRRRTIERAYVDAIRRAGERIDLACPYFYPARRFRRALRMAARRGVRVRLLLQGKADYRIAALAAQVLYSEMLAAGVRIFEYQPAFLHAKVAVIDSDWATVGSSNIDPLSLLLNLEANVIVRDRGFSAELGAAMERAFADSREVAATPVWRGWRWLIRRGLVGWAAALLLRIAGVDVRY